MTTPTHPRLDADSLAATQEAIELLAFLRGTDCSLTDPDDLCDPADALHLAWTITLQIDAYLPTLIEQARAYGHSWTHIRAQFHLPPLP